MYSWESLDSVGSYIGASKLSSCTGCGELLGDKDTDAITWGMESSKGSGQIHTGPNPKTYGEEKARLMGQ